MVTANYAKLEGALEVDADGMSAAELGALVCVDDWTVRDLCAVRLWWATSVVQWIAAGRAGGELDLPAPGYSWRETPALNQSIVARAASSRLDSVLLKLAKAHRDVLDVIDSLDDTELLQPGRFEWAGRYPLARWISMNTARQYKTAATAIHRARRRSD